MQTFWNTVIIGEIFKKKNSVGIIFIYYVTNLVQISKHIHLAFVGCAPPAGRTQNVKRRHSSVIWSFS